MINSEKFKISVVIPAFNSQKTIVAVLNSIKNQTYFELIYEIIIINDGSTDDTMNILDSYKKLNADMPLRIFTQVNKGVSAARNYGMKKANGNWIAFLDSDDLWIDDKIETQVNIVYQNPTIDFLGGNLEKEPLRILNKELEYLYKANVIDICIKNFPQPSTVIMKKKICDEIGGFDENQNHAEDGNYFLKICSKYNFYHLQKKLVNYGFGKETFGERGLSADLRAMHLGNIKNLNDLKRDNIIDKKSYYSLHFFYHLKYLRRIFITKSRQKSPL